MAAMASDSKKKLIIAVAICAASLVSALTVAAVAKNSPEYYVELHNAARSVAGAGPVSWDGVAARHAAKRAATGCAAGLRSSRSGDTVGGVDGENVFRGTGTLGRKAWAAAGAGRDGARAGRVAGLRQDRLRPRRLRRRRRRRY